MPREIFITIPYDAELTIAIEDPEYNPTVDEAVCSLHLVASYTLQPVADYLAKSIRRQATT